MAAHDQERYTAEKMADALRKARGIKAAAARALGCNRVTVDNYCRRYVTCQQAVDEARETLVDVAETQLIKQVDAGTEWAVKLTLTTLGKDRGYVPRTEQTGKDGQEITFRVVYGEVGQPPAAEVKDA